MPKKIFAVTNIKAGGEFIDAGTEVDTTKFSKEELTRLHDDGAIEIKDVDADVETQTVTELVGPGQVDVDTSVEAVADGVTNAASEEAASDAVAEGEAEEAAKENE